MEKLLKRRMLNRQQSKGQVNQGSRMNHRLRMLFKLPLAVKPSTLVAAVKAAGLVDALSNAGPFTVFAPTNAAFDKLPAGTVEGLLKPEKLEDLKGILEYHTYVGTLKPEYMNDGQSYKEQVNGGKISISKQGEKIMINGKATILASIPTSNGIIHVIDEVLLP